MTENEKFEAWISTRKLCKKYGAKLGRFADGQYRDVRVRGHFVTWLAAIAAHRNGMAVVPADALNRIMELAGVALVYQPFGTEDRKHFDTLIAATTGEGK